MMWSVSCLVGGRSTDSSVPRHNFFASKKRISTKHKACTRPGFTTSHGLEYEYDDNWTASCSTDPVHVFVNAIIIDTCTCHYHRRIICICIRWFHQNTAFKQKQFYIDSLLLRYLLMVEEWTSSESMRCQTIATAYCSTDTENYIDAHKHQTSTSHRIRLFPSLFICIKYKSIVDSPIYKLPCHQDPGSTLAASTVYWLALVVDVSEQPQLLFPAFACSDGKDTAARGAGSCL
jgi:hypothetical protein